MALPFLFLLLLSVSSISESKLSENYYKETCPHLEKVIQEVVIDKQIASPTTAAGTLRLFFHDCMVNGCDASVLISSNYLSSAERDTDINHSLPGDAFDVVVRAKTALELSCPGIVSCADILAVATRNLITMVGGPYYKVRLGRKDGFASNSSHVVGHVPMVNMTMDQIISVFNSKGFSVQEMVALVGGHTIGFSHCKEFSDRIFNQNNPSGFDPDLHPKFAGELKKLCANYKTDTSISAFNDVLTPSKFDNMYYQNLKRGLGLLPTDSAMYKDPRTKPFVDTYAANQSTFFNDFARAMEKLSIYQVKTGPKGEVRKRCDQFNNIKASNGR